MGDGSSLGCGSGPGSHEASWKEDKIACLVTMGGDLFDRDPHPELPACFRDRKAVAKLVRGLASQGSPGDLVEETAEEDQAAESAPADAEDTAVDELGMATAALGANQRGDNSSQRGFWTDGGGRGPSTKLRLCRAKGIRSRWWQVDLVPSKTCISKIHGNQ